MQTVFQPKKDRELIKKYNEMRSEAKAFLRDRIEKFHMFNEYITDVNEKTQKFSNLFEEVELYYHDLPSSIKDELTHKFREFLLLISETCEKINLNF